MNKQIEELIIEHVFWSNGYKNVSAKGAVKLCENGAIIIDVRENYHSSYKKFKAPEVCYVPLSELKEKYSELPDDILFIIADASGLRSREAMDFLKDKGFENIINLAGGIVEWERDGFPLDTDLSQMHTGSCFCQLKTRNKKG